MTENIKDFIEFHNAHVLSLELISSFENVSNFATQKHIALEDLSIEKHRLPFINWCTSIASSKI
ncbi:MAG: hypothetical protein A2Z11_01435 [Candidatus Woykebacteria bacterium RBG_16_43_9]|uniref:Uncharacterized protein n=1 Tax=Candidatus Woykebacteria bacterium RBG_16_43_9 TaxID=1802596 RepID=A0A1G1WGH5_9BACT|nr:MAG: hypothetical protein A2Z11_01435 [Candidatus Woykebacteria bacterium RBG_16_43_9]